MRIQPNSESPPAARPAVSAPSSGTAFATELASLQTTTGTTDAPRERPLAERWGEYGRGATALGFGAAPDASAFSDAPVGPDEPASPLNPSGVTTTPAFTVPGYTARGTPIPPGFYNLAYYNRYLREGGTPLEGFPLLADGATIAETYGRFGDGAVRATSFVTAPDAPDGECEHGPDATAGSETPTQPVRGPGGERVPSAAVNEAAAEPIDGGIADPRIIVASRTETSMSQRGPTITLPPSATVAFDSAVETAPIPDLGATLRAEIAPLLSDLLRVT
jgi:hypothetical protein